MKKPNSIIGKTIKAIEFCHDGSTLADCKLEFTDGSQAFISFQFCPSAEVVLYADENDEKPKRIMLAERRRG